MEENTNKVRMLGQRTNPDGSAYHGGAWVITFIFELKKNPDHFSIVQNMFLRQPVYRLHGLK